MYPKILKGAQISYSLKVQGRRYTGKKSAKPIILQFILKEPEGTYNYYYSVNNGECTLYEDKICEKPNYLITTDLTTMKNLAGNYISGLQAIKSGKFKIEKTADLKGALNLISQIFSAIKYKKMFAGTKEIPVPENCYIESKLITEIKKVLVLSSSPRGAIGATHMMVENFVEGMQRKGAAVKVLFAKTLNIKPCSGEMSCWLNNAKKCIHEKKSDDMLFFLNNFFESDLIVWAAPVWIYAFPAIVENIMSRLFITTSPFFGFNKENQMIKFRKYLSDSQKLPPYQMLLAVAGNAGFESFEPLKLKLELMGKKMSGLHLLDSLLRPQSMSFLVSDNFPAKAKDEALLAVQEAGSEIIAQAAITKATKKIAQQSVYRTGEEFACSANGVMTEMIIKKVFPFKRDKNKVMEINKRLGINIPEAVLQNQPY